jgi:DNA-binding response OmpR family regulator
VAGHAVENRELPPLILFADSERVIADTLGFIAKQLGYRVQCAYSIEGAVEALEASVPDLVVTDFAFTDGNGLALISSIRATPRFIATSVIFFNSGFIDEGLAFEAGADLYLRKPAPVKDIFCALRMLLKGAEAFRRAR